MVNRHQLEHYHSVKENGDAKSCIIVIDFSENYTCGYSRSIQSSHFGASNNQLLLHTGVVYSYSHSISFCSVSDCTRHDSTAIWALLTPILKHVRAQLPDVEMVHFWSDGSTTQYRNKHNF